MKKPYVVDFTVTYRNSIVIFAETEEEAESYADKLYATGEYDPENEGYDGCDVTARECSVTEAAEYRVRDIFETE